MINVTPTQSRPNNMSNRESSACSMQPRVRRQELIPDRNEKTRSGKRGQMNDISFFGQNHSGQPRMNPQKYFGSRQVEIPRIPQKVTMRNKTSQDS